LTVTLRPSGTVSISEMTNDEVYHRLGYLMAMIYRYEYGGGEDLDFKKEEAEIEELHGALIYRWEMGWRSVHCWSLLIAL